MMRRSLAIVLGLAALARAGGPASRPASRPQETDREALVAEHARLPRRPATTVGAFLSVAVEDGFLTAAPRVAGDGDFAIDFTDWPGFVHVQQRPQFSQFTLVHVSLTDNDTVESYTHILSHAGYLQINRDTETTTRVTSVTLIQMRQSGGNEDPVQLIVSDTPEGDAPTTAPAVPPLRVSAATFADLVRDQPEAVRTHLLPILRDLGAAGVVRGSDPARAWQALGSMTPPDPGLNKRIDALLARLDGDDFADRSKAEDELLSLGTAGAVELRRRDLSALPPDPRSVAEDAVRRVEPLPDSRAAALARDVPFLIDTLRLDEPRLSAVAAKQLEAVTGRAIALPPGLTPAEHDRRIDAYAESLRPTTGPATRPIGP